MPFPNAMSVTVGADGVDVWHRGLELGVAADAPAFVDFQAGSVEVEGVGVAGAAHTE